VLDVGAGDGTYTAELAQRSGCACILGIEPSPNAVERARDAFTGIRNLSFRCATSAHLIEEGLHFNIAVYRGPCTTWKIRAARFSVRSGWRTRSSSSNQWTESRHEIGGTPLRVPSGAPGTFVPAKRAPALDRGGRRPAKHAVLVRVGTLFLPGRRCPLGRRLEPLIELVPVARSVFCGQYVLVAQSACPCKEAKAARKVPALVEGVCPP